MFNFIDSLVMFFHKKKQKKTNLWQCYTDVKLPYNKPGHWESQSAIWLFSISVHRIKFIYRFSLESFSRFHIYSEIFLYGYFCLSSFLRRNSRVQIGSAKLEDSGNYTCVAENSLGKENGTSTVHVKSSKYKLFV